MQHNINKKLQLVGFVTGDVEEISMSMLYVDVDVDVLCLCDVFV